MAPDPQPAAPAGPTPCSRYIGAQGRHCGVIPTRRFRNDHLCWGHAPVWARPVNDGLESKA